MVGVAAGKERVVLGMLGEFKGPPGQGDGFDAGAGIRVPELEGLVKRTGNDVREIPGEKYRGDCPAMPFKGSNLFAGFRLP